MSFTRIVVFVAITAAVFYFGLNMLFPHNTAEKKAGGTVTPDQVFSSNAAATPAPQPDQAPAAPATANQPAAPTEQASAAAPAGPAAPQPLSSDDAHKMAQQIGIAGDNGQKPVEHPAASSEGSSSSGAATASSAPAGGNVASAEQVPAESAAPATPPPAAPAAATPPPAEAAAAEPAPTPAAPAAASPAPKKSKPAPSVVASTEPTSAAPPKSPAKSHAGQESTDAISVWWPAVGQRNDSHLNLLYAGEAAFEKAAVLLFSDVVSASAGSQIQILNDHGKPVSGHWEVSPQNGRMLIFKTRPGRYTLILPAELAGQSGKTLGTRLHGPVYVH
jgi:hypothetical protein